MGDEDAQRAALEAQIEQAKAAIEAIDDDDTRIPMIPLDINTVSVWRIEDLVLEGATENAIIVTVANQSIPFGFPFILNRTRGQKFASQIKRRLSGAGAPSDQKLAVPRDAGKLIIPGRPQA
jgi:hypothetical protein